MPMENNNMIADRRLLKMALKWPQQEASTSETDVGGDADGSAQ
jgi:hypothetical protein